MRTLIMAAVLTGALGSSTAIAQTTYVYSGNLMSGTGHYTVDNPGPNQAPSGSLPGYPLTLDGSITLATPLAPNLSNFAVTPTYALFGFGTPDTGGVLTGPGPSYAGPGVGGNANAYTTLNFSTLNFSTDSTGAIIGWDLTMAGTPLSLEGFTATTTQSGDSAQYLIVEPNFGGINQYDDTANSSAGFWTMSSPLSSPEIDPAGAIAGLTILAGWVLVSRGRRPA